MLATLAMEKVPKMLMASLSLSLLWNQKFLIWSTKYTHGTSMPRGKERIIKTKQKLAKVTKVLARTKVMKKHTIYTT